MIDIIEINRLWSLCHSCTTSVYNKTPPSSSYAMAVSRLLLGTAAQESNLVHRRQLSIDGTPLKGKIGGFGLWQTEFETSISNTLQKLRTNIPLLERAYDWLPVTCHEVLATKNPEFIAWFMTIPSGDPLSCLFARLHYLYATNYSIPEPLENQARYYKAYYNSYLGKATPEQYIKNWNYYCESLNGEWQFGRGNQ